MRRALGLAMLGMTALAAACFNLDGFSGGNTTDAGPEADGATPAPVEAGGTDDAAAIPDSGDAGASSGPDAAACDARAPFSDGLLAYWPFDETSGNLVGDCSGRGISGIILDPDDAGSRTPGKIGGALHVAAAHGSGCVDLGTPASLDTIPLTIATWVRVDTFPATPSSGAIGYVFGQAVDATYGGFRIGSEGANVGGTMGWVNGQSDGGSTSIEPTWPSGATWHHLAVTVDADNVTFYLDGSQLLPPTAHIPLSFAGGTSMRIGCRSDNANYFDGAIDELRIYGRVLSPAEIQTLATP